MTPYLSGLSADFPMRQQANRIAGKGHERNEKRSGLARLDAQELESGTKFAGFGNGLQSLTSSLPDTRGDRVAGVARLLPAAHRRIVARQAGGAVTVRTGDAVLLATATTSRKPREGIDFLPLTVDYEERLYAAGRIPGSFFRREGRPSEAAILLCRLVDRPLRPLFPKGYRNDVQVILTALSADQENYLDILAIIGASTALTISDVPFAGPVGAVRVGHVDGEYVFNPTAMQMEHSILDLRMSGTEDAILMVEAGAHEVPEDIILEALQQGHREMQEIIQLQKRMAAELGKPKRTFVPALPSDEVRAAVDLQLGGRLAEIVRSALSKEERNAALRTLRQELVTDLEETLDPREVKAVFDDILKEMVRQRILNEGSVS
jgi:polyribonucleotide nucleotidyltransferase